MAKKKTKKKFRKTTAASKKASKKTAKAAAKKTRKKKSKAAKKTPRSSTPEEPAFRSQLYRTVIAPPLLELMKGSRARQPVVIDLNFNHHHGLDGAKRQVCRILAGIFPNVKKTADDASLEALLDALPTLVNRFKTGLCPQYVIAELTPPQIRRLLEDDDEAAKDAAKSQLGSNQKIREYARQEARRPMAHDVPDDGGASKTLPLVRFRSVYKVWPDFDAEALVHKTVSTVKADAARVSFSATGKGMVWAVIDSGIDGAHEHFQQHENLIVQPPLRHADFTLSDGSSPFLDSPTDDFGHGTHVAGIIAGEIGGLSRDSEHDLTAVSRARDNRGREDYASWRIRRVSGIAPHCKLLSLKVLDERGRGSRRASNIIAALAYINELNEYGRNIRVHGVNLSVGYEFDAEWFGCGQSPLCIEVDRLVRSGVVVVAAAGNTGYGAIAPSASGPNMAGLSLTINDPGNANLAITVGSTHRYMPQQYGVSYFSSKGPTGDGRLKPDLVAPGENVMSCAAGRKQAEIDRVLARALNQPVAELANDERCKYREESGTSMAAPHVSGAIAAFLSIRPGYIGHPDNVRDIFLSTATDLGRERYFQGHGLVDLMRAIQSV